MHETLKISKHNHANSKNGYKTFNAKVKDSTIDALNMICKETNRSRNEIVNMILEFASPTLKSRTSRNNPLSRQA